MCTRNETCLRCTPSGIHIYECFALYDSVGELHEPNKVSLAEGARCFAASGVWCLVSGVWCWEPSLPWFREHHIRQLLNQEQRYCEGRGMAYPGGMACSTGDPQLLQNFIQGVLKRQCDTSQSSRSISF
eukprot:6623455-Pyramimonas_sp.AAC.2